jgi:hypothetical protein
MHSHPLLCCAPLTSVQKQERIAFDYDMHAADGEELMNGVFNPMKNAKFSVFRVEIFSVFVRYRVEISVCNDLHLLASIAL